MSMGIPTIQYPFFVICNVTFLDQIDVISSPFVDSSYEIHMNNEYKIGTYKYLDMKNSISWLCQNSAVVDILKLRYVFTFITAKKVVEEIEDKTQNTSQYKEAVSKTGFGIY